MEILRTDSFLKGYENLDPGVKNKFKKQFVLFAQNLFHPSLKTEKLSPKSKNIWSFRIDKNFRVIFTFSGKNIILLLYIGPHDIYRKL